MTKVPQGFDLSFLNEEEARKILQVLERNEELQRAEKDRISKLQKTKRDIRWLQGVTGEWFEEIQRKRFCNETDVSQMLKQPLTYRLRKEMAKNDPMELQTSTSKNLTNRKTSFPSGMSFRSLASLFFRKSEKETLKLQVLRQKGCDSRVGPPVSMKGTTVQTKIHNSPLENQPVDSAFVPKPAVMRDEGGMPPPWDASLMENEFFQVLDDLDSKLAQEQSASSEITRMSLNYGPNTQFSHSYSLGNRHGNITGRHKNRYNETSNMSIYDILRPGTPKEGFKTFSPRTKTIYDMYRARESTVSKEDYVQKNTFGSTSLCFDSRQQSAFPATRHFTTRSLHYPATTQNKSKFIPPRQQQSPKRTPLSSIIWNRSDSSRDRQNQDEFLRVPSPMELNPANQCTYPQCFQETRRYDLYHSQHAYHVSLNSPMENAMSPDTFENSENVPFYHQGNPFARSFFSNAFRRNREQRFGQSSLGGQQEECSSWSDFPLSRKPFISSDTDFEMISIEANSALAAHGCSVPSQLWEPFSPGFGTNVFRGQEDPHPWQSGFHASPLECMGTSHVNANQSAPHFGTPNVCSMTGSSYHIKSSGSEYQQDSCGEVPIYKESYSFGTAETVASSFGTSFVQIADDRGNSQSPNSQNSAVALQRIIPNKPDCLPTRSHTEVAETNRNSIDSPPLGETQSNILVTETNNEKDMSESISQDQQLSQMGQTNTTSKIAQPVLQTVISNPSPDFHNPFLEGSAQNDRFGFNASTTISSRRSPRVSSRKDNPQIYTLCRDKANELRKDEYFPEKRDLHSVTSLPFIQECRPPPSFPHPNQGCPQELTVSNEDIPSIIKSSHWHCEPTDNQNTQPPEEPVLIDTEGEQCFPGPTNGSKLPARHGSPCDSSDLSSGVPPDASPVNKPFPDALVIPSTTVFSRRSSLEKNLSQGEREEKDNASKDRNDQFSGSPSENQKSNESHMLVHEEGADVMKCHSYSPFRNGKGKGRIRRRISCIEKLSKTESRSIPTSEGSSLIENKSHYETSEFSTIYCTLPRKSASFLINSRQPESKIMAASIRNGPLPFQIKNNMDDPTGKYTSNKFSSGSPESTSECSKVVSDSVLRAPEATERTTDMDIIKSASTRKGLLPFLLRRAMSSPSGEACASTGRDERAKASGSDTDASAVTPRSWESLLSPLESDSSIRNGSLTEEHHQEEFSQKCTGKDGEIASSRTSLFTLSSEDPLPFCADMSGKESRKTLHKFKTTSMLSVSGDEDNVKCLEVVSIYYTLPRKPSKKFCNLLQQYAQNANSLTESLQVETETLPNALERDKLNYPTQEQLGTPSSEDLKMPGNSAQNCLSHTNESMAALQLANREPSEPTLEEMASIGPDVSLPKGESKTREIFPDNSAKTPLGDSQIRKKRGEKLQDETLHTPLMLQEKNAAKEKPENDQQSIEAGNSGPSDLPTCSEGNTENSQIGRGSGECEGSGIGVTSTGSGEWPQRDHTDIAVNDNSSGSQPREAGGKTGRDCQKTTDKMLSDSENQAFALSRALHKLQLVEETHSDEPDIESLQSEPRGLPQGSWNINATEVRKVKDEMQKLAQDQPVLPGENTVNKTNLDDLEKGENKSSVKHRLEAMSKASRKFPNKNLSPRRHVATIFPQGGSKSAFGHLSLRRMECNPPSPEPAPKSTESTDESSLNNDSMNVEKSEDPLQGSVISNREHSGHFCTHWSNNTSQLRQNDLKNVSESPPKHENSKDVAVAQIWEGEAGIPALLTFTSLREANFSDHQRRLSPPFPLEPAQKPTINLPLASCQRQQRSGSSPQWAPEPHLYRSKSLKSVNVHSDLRTSHPPKVRGRHFSESTSVDNALSQLTLGNDFSDNDGYGGRFRSFSELPSCDENENWALDSRRTKTGPKSVSSISRPIDYGIFGKEQQLAFLENVKRSLTQGRLWKPSFLKNPGFLKDDVINPPSPSQSESLSTQMTKKGLFLNEPLNIYEEDPVDSDWDTETTTDDEYYLDERDKESEL